MSLSNLPDEMKLNVLQYLTETEMKKTRTLSKTFHSNLVKRRTMYVKMKDAIDANNLDNMKWIKERFNGDIRWHDDIKFGTFFFSFRIITDNGVDMAIENLGIMKWLYENGVPWTRNLFSKANTVTLKS